MRITPCKLDGLLVIEPKVFGDARGFFLESWHRARYHEAGLAVDFVQDNFSLSRRGTLRGLHYQKPHAQGKLVSVMQGEVLDVAVDLRRRSPTFGQWHGLNLSAENKCQFYIPPGFAHGFMVLSETALFHYKCTEYYSPQDEHTVRWDDPDLAIGWPMNNPVLSNRDAQAPYLKAVPSDGLFD